MKVSFACPKCDAPCAATLSPDKRLLGCPGCLAEFAIPAEAFASDGGLRCCAVCGGGDLYVRKDFPQRLGVSILVLGFAASCVTWYFHYQYITYAILLGTALIDALLYAWVPNMLECYRCRAAYRGLPGLESHAAFNLETHERYRQQAARQAEARAAGAPRPADQRQAPGAPAKP